MIKKLCNHQFISYCRGQKLPKSQQDKHLPFGRSTIPKIRVRRCILRKLVAVFFTRVPWSISSSPSGKMFPPAIATPSCQLSWKKKHLLSVKVWDKQWCHLASFESVRWSTASWSLHNWWTQYDAHCIYSLHAPMHSTNPLRTLNRRIGLILYLISLQLLFTLHEVIIQSLTIGKHWNGDVSSRNPTRKLRMISVNSINFKTELSN